MAADLLSRKLHSQYLPYSKLNRNDPGRAQVVTLGGCTLYTMPHGANSMGRA